MQKKTKSDYIELVFEVNELNCVTRYVKCSDNSKVDERKVENIIREMQKCSYKFLHAKSVKK